MSELDVLFLILCIDQNFFIHLFHRSLCLSDWSRAPDLISDFFAHQFVFYFFLILVIGYVRLTKFQALWLTFQHTLCIFSFWFDDQPVC